MARSRARILDHDSFTGITTYWHEGEKEGTAIIQNVQGNLNHELELVKRRRAMVDERARFGANFSSNSHVAYIPPIIAEHLRAHGILDDPERLKAWLNDKDNEFVRTRPGRI